MSRKQEGVLMLGVFIIAMALCIVLKQSLIWGFAAGNGIVLYRLWRRGFPMDEVLKETWRKVTGYKDVYAVVLLMGASIAIWIGSGAVPTIVYFGLERLGNVNVLVLFFLVTGLLALVMGTGLGTLSTIGVAFMGIGIGYGIPKPLLIGVLISGAFLADKISPMSGLTLFMIQTVGVDFKTHFRASMKTLIPSALLSIGLFMLWGSPYSAGYGPQAQMMSEGIAGHFTVHPALLLLPVVLVGLSAKGVSVIGSMLTCIGLGSLSAVVLQGASLRELTDWLIFGFSTHTGLEIIDQVFRGGGMALMAPVIVIIGGAIALSHLYKVSSSVEVLFASWVDSAKSKGQLIVRTGVISLFFTSVACDQTIGVLMPANLFKEKYKQMGVPYCIMGRTISDTGIGVAPMQFWNINGLLIYSILGISAWEYLKYTPMNYIAMGVTFMVGVYYSVKDTTEIKGELDT